VPLPDVLADLEARGLLHTTTDRGALAARLADGPLTAYYGCDPTADSLHVGNLVGLLILRRLQDAGHHAIGLAGGATGLVGDPSGRSEERNLLDAATLEANAAAISTQIARIVDPDGSAGTMFVDNRDWTADLTLLDFLRTVGKHATVNQMVARESVRARMDSAQGISFTEFAYMLIQAHDYLWLHRTHGCELQIGGSDQWGNIISGVDLVRRVEGRQVHALCWPLLTAADGTKLGKTTGARVWLDPARTSPYQLFQHWMHVDDVDVEQHLLWFTLLTVSDVAVIMATHAEAPHGRGAQRALAREVTALVHGSEAAVSADAASAVLFGADPTDAPAAVLEVVAGEVPTAEVSDLDRGGPSLVTALQASGLVSSTSEARRALAQGGVYLNGQRADADRPLTPGDFLHGRYALLRRGKRSFAMALAPGSSAEPGS